MIYNNEDSYTFRQFQEEAHNFLAGVKRMLTLSPHIIKVFA